MGLIRAAAGSTKGAFADQWLEFFSYDAFSPDVLAVKGQKHSGRKSQNTKGNDNVISNGSRVAVASGQCALIIEQGQVLDVADQPGEYTFMLGGEASAFSDYSSKGLVKTSLANAMERFKFGGQPGKDTRVYYINTKEITGNKFGTANPVPFRVVDRNIGLDMDIAIRFFGQYSYHISNPILFFMNIAGNFPDVYGRSQLDSQLKSELLSALQGALAKLSAYGVRYTELPAHTEQLTAALNEVLAKTWRDKRGIELDSFSIASVTPRDEDEKLIRDLQRTAVMKDPTMSAALTQEANMRLAGQMAEAHAGALQAAAANHGGSIQGLMGLGLAQQMMGGIPMPHAYPAPAPVQPPTVQQPTSIPLAGTGEIPVTRRSVQDRSLPASGEWQCDCGHSSAGKFCAECGQPRPMMEKQYRCDKCGLVPADPANPSKFCPECGDPFNENDVV